MRVARVTSCRETSVMFVRATCFPGILICMTGFSCRPGIVLGILDHNTIAWWNERGKHVVFSNFVFWGFSFCRIGFRYWSDRSVWHKVQGITKGVAISQGSIAVSLGIVVVSQGSVVISKGSVAISQGSTGLR